MTGRLAMLRYQPFLSPDGEAEGGATGGGTSTTEGTGGTKLDIVFTPEQQAFINATIAREKREAREAVERKLKDEVTAAEDQRKRDAEAEQAKARGEFEKVEQKLKEDLTAAQGELKTVREENEKLRGAMKAGLDARWKDVPAKVVKLYKGEDDDVLARTEFLNDEAVVELIRDYAGGEEKKTVDRGSGPNPPRGESAPKHDEDAARRNTMRYS